MKKNIFSTLFGLLLMVAGFSSCNQEEKFYNGPQYALFSDSLYLMPVVENPDEVFTVPVGVTNVADYDRHYAVEVVNEKSTAVRGYHYDFVDGTENITIKKGETTAEIKLKGDYNKFMREDTLKACFRLIAPKEEISSAYKDETVVEMLQCKSFVMDEFLKEGGNIEMIASFPFGENAASYLVKGEKIDDHSMQVYIFDDEERLPIRLNFDDSDPLNPTITVPEQEAFYESSFSRVYVRSVEQYPCYFNTYENFFVLWLEVFVPQAGSFGVYQYAFRCLTQEEADDMNNGVG
ncbi:DUF4843 domain-containing protein [Phocaeicola plebeius]|uniref:DUF4984 domain-containing protein n=1 Tax=Phocaeicola plebeius (strain DSM 17135 / JCM 12973 / CCUG 54634 / M2) TaxID=484018 RepID=B5D3M7_PHOPM|nr:DUF4843 domain-containing protein [Phocaeicola plebeius]EDY94177.1 hypothetical protein BACPLE_03621 [Phocaeicola plebeius DSM 17135]